MTVAEVYHSLRKHLQSLYAEGEAAAIGRLVVEAVSGIEPFIPSIHGNRPILPHQADAAVKALIRLQRGEPVQYVIGYAHFDGMKLRVSPAVLIPRPETEELVHWVADELHTKTAAHVLDAGTGSGCIALALKRRLPHLHIFAVDISQAALEIARHNANAHGLDITFAQHDLLSAERPFPHISFDCVVCNPPYVLAAEQHTLDEHVMKHEPHVALFAPAPDPLIFYRHVAEKFFIASENKAVLFFEINPRLYEPLNQWLTLQKLPYEFRRDFSGHMRLLRIGGN
ncbi:MAG: peptide chain release factor N(5)-glutamine methyltransferase [Chitinophagales bacterium]|nr:peptide chain release factor N(5)-glutamine methyltransferase [Chitinophagales bacterium]MDW8428248.1 peptide chain release factor N(5)-glutamine methyltransferase [Chitinophagales bacterium]